MGSQWTDESAILRDLSLAQGHWVPGGIDALVAGEKPPSHVIVEETEEDYYKHWTTDVDFSTGPDLSMIKKMLEMVHDDNPNDEDSCDASPAKVEITKPMKLKTKTNQTKENPMKPRRARNVAIASLLANRQLAIAPEFPLKLSKPEDFINQKEKPINKDRIDHLKLSNESVKKVNNWLNMQDMTFMFKKKPSKAVNETQTRQSEDGRSSRKKYSDPPSCDQYTPSSWAGEYYETYVKRSHMQQLVKENVWDRAEKIMKEIDDRKAEEIRKQQEVDTALAAVLEAAELEINKGAETQTEAEDNSKEKESTKELKLTGIEKIELPQHRHLLTGDCIVCQVLTKDPLNKVETTEPESSSDTQTSQSEDTVSEESNETSSTGNDEPDQEIFSLGQATFVENLGTLETTDLKCMLTEPDLEELDIFA